MGIDKSVLTVAAPRRYRNRDQGRIHLDRLPRMADFALWAAACETALWPAGTFARTYGANRRTAIEGMIDADPVAACVREIMAERGSWTGSAAELWRADAHRSSHDLFSERTGWPKNPRALAGRLRRAQTFLRALGIHIAFSREGRAGGRVIRIRTNLENTASTVSSVRHNDHDAGSIQPPPGPVGGDPDGSHRPSVGAADDADGADANAAPQFRERRAGF